MSGIAASRMRARVAVGTVVAVVVLLATAPVASASGFRIFFSAKPAKVTRQATATLRWGSNHHRTTYKCSLDGAAFHRCGKSLAVSTPADRKHTFSVKGSNGRGTIRRIDWAWTVDTVAPTVPTVAGGSDSWLDAASTSFTATSHDALSGLHHYQYRLWDQPGGAGVVRDLTPSWGSPVTSATGKLSVTREGPTWVEFRAIDRAGNVSGWSADTVTSRSLLDRTAPTLGTLDYVAGIMETAPSFTDAQYYDALSGIASVGIQQDVTGVATPGVCATFPGSWATELAIQPLPFSPGVASGSCYRYRLHAIDNVGNEAFGSIGSSVLYDNTAPTFTAMCTGCATLANQTANGTITDDGAGFDSTTFAATYDDGNGHTGSLTGCIVTSTTWICDLDASAITSTDVTLTITGDDFAGNSANDSSNHITLVIS